MANWKTLVFPCLLVSASLIAALPQRREGSHEIDPLGILFDTEINPGALDIFPSSKNNMTEDIFENQDIGSNNHNNQGGGGHSGEHHGGHSGENHGGHGNGCCSSIKFFQTRLNGKY